MHLIGSKSKAGVANLSLVSSLVHIGSNPAQVAFVMRPLSAKRDTYQNLKDHPFFTVNIVQENFLKQAHYASAKFDADVNEFEELGLTESYWEHSPSPFVEEAQLRFSCEVLSEQVLPNETILMIGSIRHIEVSEKALQDDGSILFPQLGAVAVTGLNHYHRVTHLMELPYARTSEVPQFKNPNTKQRPDNVVFDAAENKYTTALKKYATNIGAPAIIQEDMNHWKNIGTSKVNHHLKTQFENIKSKYEEVLELYQWNEIIYQSKFEFEPITGEVYHLYAKDDNSRFLSQIAPHQWNRKHLGSFRLNQDRIFEKMDPADER